MIIDGRAIAGEILDEVRSQAGPLVIRAVVGEPSPATESYLRIKTARAADANIQLHVVRLPDGATTEAFVQAIEEPGVDAVIVQLPVPERVDLATVLNAIPVSLDADVLSDAAYERFVRGEGGALLPPVVGAIEEVCMRAGIAVAGKRAVVVGGGRLVGQPAALWLSAHGAAVETITKESGDLSSLKQADMVVLGAGSPGLIQPEHLKEGVVLVDAGTSESGGAIVGDADPRCADVASVFTPVPGGIGPIAVACLMKNVAQLARLRTS